MRPFLLLLLMLAALGCDRKPSDSPDGPGPAAPQPGATPAALAAPASGAIAGRPFTPDQVTLEGKALSFRTGKDFFADMEIKFTLPDRPGAGREWRFAGDNFENPTLTVAARQGQELPKTDFVFPKDYTMTLTITKSSSKEVVGVIDLQVTKPGNTRLVGTFTAGVKKTADDPLGPEDAPFVQGRITVAGPWEEVKLAAGFFGKGADGKVYSNMAGTTLKPDGGGATSLTFEPQRTSVSGGKNGPAYRHTHLPPGEYVVYVSRDDVLSAWKKVTVKAGEQLTADLTIDPANTGTVTVTLPEAEANDTNEASLSLIPAELDRPGEDHYAFHAAQPKKAQTTVTVKGVPAGKYRAVRGKSSAAVEVVAGQEAKVTLTGPADKK